MEDLKLHFWKTLITHLEDINYFFTLVKYRYIFVFVLLIILPLWPGPGVGHRHLPGAGDPPALHEAGGGSPPSP